MSESLIQQYYVGESGRHIRRKTFSLRKKMTLLKEEAPANFVPAAAVRRGGQALSGLIRRKEFVGSY